MKINLHKNKQKMYQSLCVQFYILTELEKGKN